MLTECFLPAREFFILDGLRAVLSPPRPPASWGGFDADAPDSKKPAITDGLYNIRASYTHAN